ncbi:transcription repressor NadR [Paenibacillus sp. P96]|uniref:Transcription repressor NadR n=1 Tax=Paenibacillus zeirhizosphaerae TaxID=2987519 RepID=A0ABT9FRZ6_9BACL|nr:transcription repressor NadR [Paenibacillus sp. P96]MDP4097242.1 transcription repressor NadR [Paenibacillus sp. P96]
MSGEIKLSGAERREKLLQWLKENSPLTGSELARRSSVSRQVIVQDITLLKARNEPIMATSQGYMYLAKPEAADRLIERIVAVQHGPERTEEELQLIVDYGVTVKDVIVEHPVYGELTAPILASTRQDVHQFILRITSTKASYLSELTGGVHLHTLTAPDQERLDQACQALERAGFLLADS